MNILRFYVGFVLRFLRFYRKAKTKYDIHSPFVASFLRFVVTDRRNFYAFPVIEAIRKRLLQNPYPIRITDYGAGSKANPAQVRTVRSIARYGAVSPRIGRILFKAVLYCNPSNVLEMGASLGISGLYLRMAKKTTPFITLEGCPETAAEARNNFAQAGCADVCVRTGPFAETLPLALWEYPTLDFLYLDGDHRAGASLSYVEACLHKASTRSVFAIADIHWSKEMERAWELMCAHPKVRVSVDLFWIGFLFFDDAVITPQHYVWVPWYAKPWRLGIFS